MVLLVLVAIEDFVRYTSFVTNGNVDSPFATVGGAGHGLYKAGAKGALKGGGTGMFFYQINGEQRKVLATNISQTQITLSKQLVFKNGKLYDGETLLTGTLAEGVEHKIKVWAVDSENEQSDTIERTFYVVPNRAPLLSIDAVVPSGIINTDKFKISGITSDQDANSTVTVNYRINGANPVEIYTGTGGAWEFEILLSQLKV
ncbi:hypothetical protein [Lysinibacillus fusiformis]|uniref:hypothetical protein n=1 Tax=Lysinibacillus fusiformis TaxID=28031 RepID=UPI00383001BC